jgi:hypothetical protein
VQPGYIDPDVIAHSLNKKPRKAGNGMEFRFAQKQDDEYYNPNSGVNLFVCLFIFISGSA